MIAARVVENNRPDDMLADGVVFLNPPTLSVDSHTGAIVATGIDAACDPVELRAELGQMIQFYH